MKLTENTVSMLNTLSITPASTKKLKVDVSAVRELVQSDTVNRSAVLATVTMLAFLADKTPMAFEERKNVEVIVEALTTAKHDDSESINAAVKALTEIVGYYTNK